MFNLSLTIYISFSFYEKSRDGGTGETDTMRSQPSNPEDRNCYGTAALVSWGNMTWEKNDYSELSLSPG